MLGCVLHAYAWHGGGLEGAGMGDKAVCAAVCWASRRPERARGEAKEHTGAYTLYSTQRATPEQSWGA